MPIVHKCKEGYKWCPKCQTEVLKSGFNKASSRMDGLRGLCRECDKPKTEEQKAKRKEMWNKYYSNPDKRLAAKIRGEKWYEENVERHKENIRRQKRNNRRRNYDNNNASAKKRIEALHPTYMKQMLKSKGFILDGLDPEQISELIQIQTIITKTRRLCRTSQNSEKALQLTTRS